MLGSLYTRLRVRGSSDRGDIMVQRVVLMAGTAFTAILLATWIGQASMNKAADASQCTENSGALKYAKTHVVEDNLIACGVTSIGHASYMIKPSGQAMMLSYGSSFNQDAGFTSRYPGQNAYVTVP